MDGLSTLLITGLFVLIAAYWYRRKKDLEHFPPGPTIYPVIGNAHRFGTFSDVKKGKQLWEEFGSIVGIQLGPIKMVFISDPELLREAFSTPAFMAKSDWEMMHQHVDGKHGIIASDGDTWLDQRRFAIRQLRDFGFGKTHMEDIIMEEANDFLGWLKAEEGRPLLLEKRLSIAILNNIWHLLYGQRFKHDDPRIGELLHNLHAVDEAMSSDGKMMLFMIFGKSFSNYTGYNQVVSTFKNTRDYFKKYITEHKNTLEEGQEPRDVVDAFLMEMEKQKGSDSSFNEKYGLKNLVAMSLDFFQAGHETTTATLLWFFLYICKNPQVQRKMQEEIDTVVGKSRQVAMSDKAEMVYTEAVITETLRHSTIAPYGAPHTAAVDTPFHGYIIPKGAMITGNFYNIHHDPKFWSDPDAFKPERFLSADGKTFVSNKSFMPFSIGKRSCVGELMARQELFLFSANILQKFNVKFDPNFPVPGEDEHKDRFIVTPKDFQLIFTER